MIMENINIFLGVCIMLGVIGYTNYKYIITRSERIIKDISKLTKN